MSMIDLFFTIITAAGIAGTLYYVADAHLWRISEWRERRRLDRMIREHQ